MTFLQRLATVRSAQSTLALILLVSGGIGGFISTYLPNVEAIGSNKLLSIFLGAIAAFLFVILVSNTDRSDTLRLLAISILAGMAWQSVLVGLQDTQLVAASEQRAAAAEQRAAAAHNDLQVIASWEELAQQLHDIERLRNADNIKEYSESVDAILGKAVNSASDITSDDARELFYTMLAGELADHKYPLSEEIVARLAARGESRLPGQVQ